MTNVPITLIWPMDFIKGATVAAITPAIIVGMGNLGGIIGPQIFGASETLAGTYIWAAMTMGICEAIACVLSTVLWYRLKRSEKDDDSYKLPHI